MSDFFLLCIFVTLGLIVFVLITMREELKDFNYREERRDRARKYGKDAK